MHSTISLNTPDSSGKLSLFVSNQRNVAGESQHDVFVNRLSPRLPTSTAAKIIPRNGGPWMGEHSAQSTFDRFRTGRKQSPKQTASEVGHRLLEIIVYGQNCRAGGHVSLDDLDTNDVGDWKMSDYKTACIYAASQGWLTLEDDTLTLTTAGLAAA